MTESINELERDIEETRARLDLTIERIQDRMSPSGIVDEFLGVMRVNQFSSTFDRALEVVRRNPIPVLLIVAGGGWLAYRMARDRDRTRELAVRRPMSVAVVEEEEVVVAGPAGTRVYEVDVITTPPPPRSAFDDRTDLASRA